MQPEGMEEEEGRGNVIKWPYGLGLSAIFTESCLGDFPNKQTESKRERESERERQWEVDMFIYKFVYEFIIQKLSSALK